MFDLPINISHSKIKGKHNLLLYPTVYLHMPSGDTVSTFPSQEQMLFGSNSHEIHTGIIVFESGFVFVSVIW